MTCHGTYCEEHEKFDACDCEECLCGHCLHAHEKWRWYRLCRECTPLAYDSEVPSELDERPGDFGEALTIELNRHWKKIIHPV